MVCCVGRRQVSDEEEIAVMSRERRKRPVEYQLIGNQNADFKLVIVILNQLESFCIGT